MVLSWHRTPPKPDPFAAAVGDSRQYIVYFSESEAYTDETIQQDVYECLGKAVNLIKDNLTSTAAYFLIEWDVVYCIVTVVVTDHLMENDSINVVKCQFIELDKLSSERFSEDEPFEAVTSEIASKVKSWSSEFVKNAQMIIDSDLEVLFHCETRANAVKL